MLTHACQVEVAHARDREHYERLKRRISLAVLVLTTLTGAGVVTTLTTSVGSVGTTIVAVLSVLAAVAAVLNEKGPFGDQVQAHHDAAAAFNKAHRKLVVLHRDWTIGEITNDSARDRLADFEISYDDLEDGAPDLRDYQAAHHVAAVGNGAAANGHRH